jgi:hypothetical protein
MDNIEAKTGKTPNEIIAMAKEKGFTADSKAGEIISWLKSEFGLGHGHAMAIVQVFKHGPKIDGKHVGTGTAHNDDTDMLKLDGKADKS